MSSKFFEKSPFFDEKFIPFYIWPNFFFFFCAIVPQEKFSEFVPALREYKEGYLLSRLDFMSDHGFYVAPQLWI